MKRAFLYICVIALFLSVLTGCRNAPAGSETNRALDTSFLCDDIPKPAMGTVTASTSDASEGYHSFKVEDFTLSEAQAYIDALEASCVSREIYQLYEKTEYPILNYLGRTDSGGSISISQSGETAMILINSETIDTLAP